MAIITDEKKIHELLTRGVEEVIEYDALREKLASGKPLRVKLGIDPTSPNIHLGRAIPLLKLRDFQELGHRVVFVVGDFTGTIGDTSDKESERPMLKRSAVEENMKSYVLQAGKIIDINKAEVVYNSTWLAELGYEEIGFQADQFSLNEFISRENIKKRLDAGKRIVLREVLYPLMQGYDSVKVEADVEVGGTDQRFNILAGRTLQRAYGQEPQNIVLGPLIEGLDGRKMSSSWGNTINLLDEPNDMFGKVMSLRDELIVKYFTLLTRISMEEIEEIQKRIEAGENPMPFKKRLALEIVKCYYSENDALQAQNHFEAQFQKKEVPEDAPVFGVAEGSDILSVLKTIGFAASNSEGRRKIGEGAVKVDGEKISSDNFVFEKGEYVLKLGRKLARIVAK